MDPAILIYGAILVAVPALVTGLYLTVFGRAITNHQRAAKRLAQLERQHARPEVLEALRKEMGQEGADARMPVRAIIGRKLEKAALSISPVQLVGIMAVVAAAVFLGLTLATDTGLVLRATLSPVAGAALVMAWVNKRAKARLALIEEQLPDAVELMVRSLRVGHPFASAVQIVAKETAEPFASEMAVIADETIYGRDVGEALAEMAERLDIQDLRFLAVAVTIQQQSGGNLAEVLDGLAKVIRSRFKLFRRVKAITAEAKWSGTFLSGFPIVALIGIKLADPTYFDEVMQTAYFTPACFVVGGFLLANVIVMRRLVDIKV